MRRKLIVISIICMFLLTSFTVLPIAGVKISEATSKVIKKVTPCYMDISAEKTLELMNFDPYTIVIDVRTYDEHSSGYIKDALAIPFSGCGSCFLDEIEQYKDKKIIIYCKDGARGQLVCNFLIKHGFKTVYNLHGGLDAWVTSGFQITESSVDNKCIGHRRYYCGAIPLSKSEIKKYRLENIYLLRYSDIPPSWDWRNAEVNGVRGDWTTRIKDQGECGSCWAFSALGVLEAGINIEKGDPDFDINLAEQQLLSCDIIDLGCNGGNAATAYKQLMLIPKAGITLESCFPYMGVDRWGQGNGSGDYSSVSSDDKYGKSAVRCRERSSDWKDKRVSISSYGLLSSILIPYIGQFSIIPIIGEFVEEYFMRPMIKNRLITKGPLCAAMAAYNDFLDYNGGIYNHRRTLREPELPMNVNHQIIIVGYDDDQGCWICKNSWGANWGERGWFRIAYGDCQIGLSEIIWVNNPHILED